MNKTMVRVVGLVAAFGAGFVTNRVMPGEAVAQAQARPRVYELRTYTAVEGRLDALHARFKDHLLGYFQKHGMTNVGYWTNVVGGRSDELWYLLGYEDMGARRPA